MAETSDRVSSIAARRLNITGLYINGQGPRGREELAADIRALSASALRQDETRGQSILRKIAKMIRPV